MFSKYFLILGVGALAVSHGAYAASIYSGQVSKYHLNGDIAGRGACIQMNPALPTTWACLYQSNSLYKEINAALLAANMSQKNCSFGTNTTDSAGYPVISYFECN